ncbi:FliH/SctL family protein [Falsiroseomonas selenitidurans]|uniref:Flagellar assembly protein FliH n=1 Tax=Falsiroseomonas selenitidurans TaxID=2716335 RepID=A0ABX1DY43_9PROT|nr:hypothetical protein [Falsiroseomonas selenitidurans]NKC29824.1 hypothetical protein [Falsiroseomonas selenitidurans]
MMRALRLPDLGAPPPPPPEPEPPPPDPAALAEAARAEGVLQGRAIGHAAGLKEGRAEQAAAQQAAIQRALERIATQMAGAEQAGQATAEAGAQALAGLLMQVLDLALPGAAARLGPEIVAHLVPPLRQAIADRPEAVLHVAPGLVEAVAALLPPGSPPVVADAALPAGDARVAWRDGAVVIALAARRAAIAQVLRAVGIWNDATPEGEQEMVA